jgi:hypothetical protein
MKSIKAASAATDKRRYSTDVAGPKPTSRQPANTSTKAVRIPRVPIEWMDAGCWRLPSGKALAEFALQAGFLAPLLFPVGSLDRWNGSPAWRSKARGEHRKGIVA